VAASSAAIERMVLMKGGYGRVVWMPTFDARIRSDSRKRNAVRFRLANGALLQETKAVIALAAEHGLLLETGHSSAEECLMLLREPSAAGVQHKGGDARDDRADPHVDLRR